MSFLKSRKGEIYGEVRLRFYIFLQAFSTSGNVTPNNQKIGLFFLDNFR